MTSRFSRNVPGSTERLRSKCVGVAGLGGLGSNAAISLARAGVGRLILVDDDVVEESNLNRQHYFLPDVGRRKIDALSDHLRSIDPSIAITAHFARITPENVPDIFGPADLLLEAFDRAESKRWLIGAWCASFPRRPIVCGNGLSGLGRTEDLEVRRIGNVTFCGDGETEMALGLCSARVAIVANMEANVAIERLLE